ncbi:MAG TPA: hypothetical protein DIW17_09770 [Clostridiales bacterium]|nr:hypothetical protein [Clostridiales bacterium]
METFHSAVEIFKVLVSQGEFNRKENPELFSRYLDTEVHEALSFFEQQFNCKFLYFDDTVYLVPEIDSSILGMEYSDFRSYFLSNATRREVYLGFYIMMFIFYEFYSGKNRDPKKMDFLQISTLIDHLDERFERLSNLSEEEMEGREENYRLNLSSSIEVWKSMLVDHESKRATKYNLIRIVCRILEDQKLAYIVEDQIRPCPRLDVLMRQHYLHADRVALINKAFEKGEL